jgi:sulfite exporter TauE/SafE
VTDPINLGSAFIIGLLGGAHCVGMCGGIMNALSFAIPEAQRRPRQLLPILLLYNLGRITSYGLAGALIGLLGAWLQSHAAPMGPALRIVAGLLLIAMGLYLAGWWRGLAYLELAGSRLWRHLQPLGNALLPVTRPGQALLLGALWGWLPCGLVYSTLALTSTAASWQQAALTMVSFGLGTLPVMLVSGVFAHRLKHWLQQSRVRYGAALLIIAFGLWTLLWPLSHAGGHKHPVGHKHPDGHQHASEQPHSAHPVKLDPKRPIQTASQSLAQLPQRIQGMQRL